MTALNELVRGVSILPEGILPFMIRWLVWTIMASFQDAGKIPVFHD